MKNEELFNKTLNILVQAYQNDTLKHGDCAACVVGNLIASNLEYTFNEEGMWLYSFNQIRFPRWKHIFITVASSNLIYCNLNKVDIINQTKEYTQILKKENKQHPSSIHQLQSTGYSIDDLMKIEWAFETADKGNNKDDYMFNGLLAVYDVLCDIHEVKEPIKGELVFA